MSHIAKTSSSGRIALNAPKEREMVKQTPRSLEEIKECIREQNTQMAQLKEQYIRLRTLLHEERKSASLKYLSLERQLNIEKKRIENAEAELSVITPSSRGNLDARGAIEVVEKIWLTMKKYRDAMRTGYEPVIKPDPTQEHIDPYELPQIDEGDEDMFTHPKRTPTGRGRYSRH